MFDSLVAKDCQYPRDPLQPAIKKKKKDNSDKPSYLLWPIRGANGQFLLVDPWSGNYFDLEAAKFMEPIGFEHFFDAFALDRKRSLKVDAAAALHIPLNDVSDSLVVKQDRANRFELTPVWTPVEPPAKRAKTAEVRLSSASDVPMPPRSDDNAKGSSDEEDSDSSGSNSDVSSQDDSSDVSDLEKFDEACTDFGALTDGVDPQTLERDGSEVLVTKCLLSIWLRQFLRCFGMYWIIPARSSMIQRLSPCSYLSSGSTPFTERCLTQLPGIDLASLWSYDERLVGW